MSNCINIYNPMFTFTCEQFDIPKFQKELENHNHKEFECEDWFCWFLKENHKIIDDNITFYFGCGNSTHTWRDFEYVMLQLNQWFKQELKLKFELSDEYDNHKCKFITIITTHPRSNNW